MNKAIVIDFGQTPPMFIECKDNNDALTVYDIIISRMTEVAVYNVTIIFTDGSIRNSHCSHTAEASMFLQTTDCEMSAEDLKNECDLNSLENQSPEC